MTNHHLIVTWESTWERSHTSVQCVTNLSANPVTYRHMNVVCTATVLSAIDIFLVETLTSLTIHVHWWKSTDEDCEDNKLFGNCFASAVKVFVWDVTCIRRNSAAFLIFICHIYNDCPTGFLYGNGICISFLPAWCYAIAGICYDIFVCLWVSPRVSKSHVCFVSKLPNVLSKFFYHLIALSI